MTQLLSMGTLRGSFLSYPRNNHNSYNERNIIKLLEDLDMDAKEIKKIMDYLEAGDKIDVILEEAIMKLRDLRTEEANLLNKDIITIEMTIRQVKIASIKKRQQLIRDVRSRV